MTTRTWLKCIPRAFPLGVAAVCCLAPALASATSTWDVTQVDGSASAVGQYASLALDSNKKAHVSYYDAAGKLKYATDKSGVWVVPANQPVSSGVTGAGTSIALDGTTPQINYYSSPSGNRGIRNIVASGTGWASATNPDSNNYAPTAGASTTVFNRGGYSYVLYSNNGTLYYTRNQTQNSYTGWNTRQTVDSSTGNLINSALVVNTANGYAYAVGYSSGTFDLYYYTNESGSWVRSTIQSASSPNSVGKYCSLAIDAAGKVHLSYLEAVAGSSYHVRYRMKPAAIGSTFGAAEDVGDVGGSAGGNSSIAVDAAGVPHVSFYYNNGTDRSLRYNNKLGGTWHAPEIVDAGSATLDLGNFPSMAVDSDNTVHVVYYDATNTTLKAAIKTPLVLSQASVTFGPVDRGFESNSAPLVNITNNLMVNLTLGSVALAGSNPGDFILTTNTCAGATLLPQQDCSVQLHFAPPASAPRSSGRSAAISIPATAPFSSTTLLGISGSTTSNYLVTADAGNGGSISPSRAAVAPGGSQSFSVTPDAGFSVKSVTLDGTTEMTAPYSLSSVAADHSILASLVSPIRMQNVFYGSLYSAFSAANNGWTIQTQASIPGEELEITRDLTLNLFGGYDSSFTSQSGMTEFPGNLTISNGILTVDSLTLQ